MNFCQYLLTHVINNTYDCCVLSKVLMINTAVIQNLECQ